MNNFWLFHSKYEKLFTSKSIIRKAYCDEMTAEQVFEYILNLYKNKNQIDEIKNFYASLNSLLLEFVTDNFKFKLLSRKILKKQIKFSNEFLKY